MIKMNSSVSFFTSYSFPTVNTLDTKYFFALVFTHFTFRMVGASFHFKFNINIPSLLYIYRLQLYHLYDQYIHENYQNTVRSFWRSRNLKKLCGFPGSIFGFPMAFCLFIISHLSPFPDIRLIFRLHDKKIDYKSRSLQSKKHWHDWKHRYSCHGTFLCNLHIIMINHFDLLSNLMIKSQIIAKDYRVNRPCRFTKTLTKRWLRC